MSEINLEKNTEKEEILSQLNEQKKLKDIWQKKWLKIGLLFLFGLVLLTGVFYAELKIFSKKKTLKNSLSSPQLITSQITNKSSATPTMTPSPQKLITQPIINQNPPVTSPMIISPEKYGFINTLELKEIGVKAQFPQNVNISSQEENSCTIETDDRLDAVSFSLKAYDGKGRRAWFQKTYPAAKDYVFESFAAKNHSGYIAYDILPKDLPGRFYYFAAINPNTMLVVTASDYINRRSVFYSRDLQRVKSFLSTIELISKQKTVSKTYLSSSELYRWSNTRKTVWEDTILGLKITTPDWIEVRYIKGKDSDGNFIYTDWKKEYPEAKIYDSTYLSENIKKVEVTQATYTSFKYLNILPLKYQEKSFSEIVNELLISAGFCATEWKNSKEECISLNFCYTRNEVVQNLIIKRQIKIGNMDAQLINLNQDFSSRNDCRSEDTWVIKAKNGQFILSNISSDNEPVRIESL